MSASARIQVLREAWRSACVASWENTPRTARRGVGDGDGQPKSVSAAERAVLAALRGATLFVIDAMCGGAHTSRLEIALVHHRFQLFVALE